MSTILENQSIDSSLQGILAVLSGFEVGHFNQRLATNDDPTLKAIMAKLNKTAEVLEAQARVASDQQEFFNTVMSTIPSLVSYIDRDLIYRFVNLAYEKWFGVSREQCLGRSVIDVIGKTAGEIARVYINAAFAGEAQTFEAQAPYRTGGHRYVQVKYIPYRESGGQVTGVTVIVHDLTELRKNSEHVQKIEEGWKAALEGVGDGLWDGNPQTGECTFSKQLEEMLGYEEGEFPNDSEKYGLLIHPEDFPRAMSDLQACMEGKTALYTNEHRVRCKDGSWKWILDRGVVVLRDENGKALRVVGTHLDLTERKAVEKERAFLMVQERKARENAENSNRIKDEFLATLSHELRTPLTTILSWAQMLRMGRLAPEKAKRGIEILEESAKAQGQLINDLLDVSSIQAGKLKLVLEIMDLQKVITASIDSVRSLATHKSIQIATEVDPTVEIVYADPYRLQQVLWNLFSNAIKFSNPGGKILIKVDRVVVVSAPELRIQVCDSGKGIKPEFLSIIFDRFSQADNTATRAYGGLGLGLAIVQNLVEMHAGKIEVSSPGIGKGSTFTVWLPIGPEEAIKRQKVGIEGGMGAEAGAASGVRVSPLGLGMSATILQGISILLVEDEKSVSEILVLMLESCGGKVRSSPSVSEALTLLMESRPDVIVSDIAMPGEDGYSFMLKVRAMGSDFSQIPAIALTAYAGKEDINRALAAGFQVHLAKPVESNKLVQAIGQLAKRKTPV